MSRVPKDGTNRVHPARWGAFGALLFVFGLLGFIISGLWMFAGFLDYASASLHAIGGVGGLAALFSGIIPAFFAGLLSLLVAGTGGIVVVLSRISAQLFDGPTQSITGEQPAISRKATLLGRLRPFAEELRQDREQALPEGRIEPTLRSIE